MKAVSFLVALVLCLIVAVSAPAEITTDEAIEFPTFSCSVSPGSYLIRGSETDNYLFICYPEYTSGNTNISINASMDTLVDYNPASMDIISREMFGNELLRQTTEQLAGYGFTVSDAKYSWGNQVEVDGQAGILLNLSMKVGINGTTVQSCSTACFVCAGSNRYNFSAGAESEELCMALLQDFIHSVQWKGILPGEAAAPTPAVESEVLGKAAFVTLMDGKMTPSTMLDEGSEGILAALFFLELEKNPEITKRMSFLLENYSERNIYAGIDRQNRAFSAFPEFRGENYLVIARDGNDIVKVGMFDHSGLETFLNEAAASKPVNFYFFLGSYQGLCQGMGLDPAPYNY